MQVQTLDDKITRFLNNKFRISRSYATKRTYESALKQFEKTTARDAIKKN